MDVPIRGNGDEEFFTLHGIYGLGEVEDTYDMLRICEAYRNRLKRFVPIGFDDCNGQILYVRNGLRKGQVWFMPWDSFSEPGGKEVYYVAKSMKDFADLIERLAAEDEGA